MARVSGDLGFDLHKLTAELDRAADRILGEANGLSYRRFVTLLLVGELHDPTQRELAAALRISEPSASRMITVLAGSGHLEVERAPGGGNRKRLRLTPTGKDAVDGSRELLEGSMARLLAASGVPYDAYARHTRTLLQALITGEGGSP